MASSYWKVNSCTCTDKRKFYRVFSFLAGTSGTAPSVDAEIVEREKVLQNLEFCVEKIGDIFNLNQIADDYRQTFADESKNKVIKEQEKQKLAKNNPSFT